MPARWSTAMTEAMAAVAPGTPLREGLDRILQASMGALIVVGDGPEVLSICSGGFLLDAEFSPQRLSELAKMDGAIILTADSQRIARANVHLMPDPSVPTSETGTRHRTAERVARSLNVPTISVSEDMAVIAVYRGADKQPLESTPRLVNRANQALQTLERYKNRLDAVTASLAALEVEDLVTVRDVVTTIQRAEMVRRIADEVRDYVVQLGTDGRLVLLQLEELIGGFYDDRVAVIRDYLREATPAHGGGRAAVGGNAGVERALRRLTDLGTEELLDPIAVAHALGLPSDPAGLDSGVSPRGFRLLSRIPRLPATVVSRVVAHFGTLHEVMRASVEQLDDVDGVGHGRAVAIKEGLSRLAESSIFDRYT